MQRTRFSKGLLPMCYLLQCFFKALFGRSFFLKRPLERCTCEYVLVLLEHFGRYSLSTRQILALYSCPLARVVITTQRLALLGHNLTPYWWHRSCPGTDLFFFHWPPRVTAATALITQGVETQELA